MAERLMCEVCSCRPASLVLLRRKNGDSCRVLVCSDCAEEKTRLYATASFDLRQAGLGDAGRQSWMADPCQCELCGADLADAGTDVQPGCCECYTRFSELFVKAAATVQGHTRHLGKSPAR